MRSTSRTAIIASSFRRGRDPLESVGLRLRSANAPRLRRGLPAGLGHDLSEPIGALSASPLEDHDHGHACAVVGGWIDGEIGNAVKRPMPMLGPLGARPIFDLADESDEPLQGPVEARSSVGSLCAVGVTGHHFALESRAVGTGRGKKTRGECKNCGLERWIGPGARRKTLLIGKVSKRIKPAASRHSSDPTTPDFEACFSLDVLLEALCFTRAGSWAQFDRLAAQCSDESWFVAETARLLSSLGHIDFQLDLRTHRPQTWHVAPTALVNVDNKTAIIVGHRSDDILERVADDAEALGGRLTKESRDGAPAKLIVRGLDLSALFQLAESVAEATSNPTRVCAAGARGIAEVLPAWTDLLGALKMAPWPAEPMERFDVGQNRWVPVPMLSAAGAYKTVSRPSLFSFYPGMGSELWVADSRTIKWLAAACEGQSILGYDRDTQVLRCLLGAQLPGLYERAAVLCSGDAPVVETSGTVAYATVTADVAAAISGRLGS